MSILYYSPELIGRCESFSTVRDWTSNTGEGVWLCMSIMRRLWHIKFSERIHVGLSDKPIRGGYEIFAVEPDSELDLKPGDQIRTSKQGKRHEMLLTHPLKRKLARLLKAGRVWVFVDVVE